MELCEKHVTVDAVPEIQRKADIVSGQEKRVSNQRRM